MPPTSEIRIASTVDLPVIAHLAAVIWRAHYPGIISNAQIEYMLGRVYDIGVMECEMADHGVVYEIVSVDGQPIGFVSYGPADHPDELKMHKLYVHPEHQGRGYGATLIRHVIDVAKRGGYAALILAVNKNNHKAIASYRRNGFEIRESVVVEIGGGYVMDDYVMVYRLTEGQ